MESPIIVALDGYSKDGDFEKVLALAEKLKDKVWGYKVNDFFTKYGWDGVKALAKLGKIMLDMKFYDIPNTVENHCKTIDADSVQIVTVHAHGGEVMMAAASKVLPGKIAAVSVLTSFSTDEYGKIHACHRSIREQVKQLAICAHNAKCGYLVCSPEELSFVADLPGLKKITPGIRPSWHQTKDDQKRVATPASAITHGADLMVIGRPILQAADPVEAVEKTLEELKDGNV